MTVVLTTLPSDSHSWNLVALHDYLDDAGYRVVNLGICVPLEELARACREHRPRLVAVSTLNGHAYLEAPQLAAALAELAGRSRFKLVIGGNLGTDRSFDATYAAALLDAGFDAVFAGPDALAEFEAFLKREVPSRPDAGRPPLDEAGPIPLTHGRTP